MNIFKTLTKMREACPVGCEVSISLVDDNGLAVKLFWQYKIKGVSLERRAIITEIQCNDSVSDVIEKEISEAKSDKWVPNQCEHILSKLK